MVKNGNSPALKVISSEVSVRPQYFAGNDVKESVGKAYHEFRFLIQ